MLAKIAGSVAAISAFVTTLTLGSPTQPILISPIHPVTKAEVLAAMTTPIPTATPTQIESEPTPLPTATPTPTATPVPLPTSTPTPIESGPTPIPTIPISVDLEAFFVRYSTEYTVDKELLKRIAACESGFNTNAVNGPYGGMFQFSESSWTNTRTSMGQSTDQALRFHAEEAIKTAAYKISRGGQNAWPNCK